MKGPWHRRAVLIASSVGVSFAALLSIAVPAAAHAQAANYLPRAEVDFLTRDFHFASGESLPELRVHYRTLGKPRADAQAQVLKTAMILHGNGGAAGCLVG